MANICITDMLIKRVYYHVLLNHVLPKIQESFYLNVPKCNRKLFGKRDFVVCGPMAWDLVMNWKHSNGTKLKFKFKQFYYHIIQELYMQSFNATTRGKEAEAYWSLKNANLPNALYGIIWLQFMYTIYIKPPPV